MKLSDDPMEDSTFSGGFFYLKEKGKGKERKKML